MFRIAVCDNDNRELEVIERYVKKYLSQHTAIDSAVYTYQHSNDLKAAISGNSVFDLYLLDIMMPEIDGISLGRLIRQKTSVAHIVYITSTKAQAFEAFGVHALQYLIKPINEKCLFDVLDTAYSLYKTTVKNTVILESDVGLIPVVQDEIMYIENTLRTASYTMLDGSVISCTRGIGSFENAVYPLTKNMLFIQPHKSYFANMQYIKLFQDSLITMDNDKLIPINQRRLPMIRKRYMDYLSSSVLGDIDGL